mmetsp:Transcript_12303/g.12343  ORF Transcript_12303/g.12343 Transcript_12303/m.12343 type:complete len:148 (+) Transcript_12303:18-461(+)|eukprot:CAMPEP_0197010438 /NCGR_PEP_ID=MMETSP1380-20130617/54283_1 /TAXON_ID=5936 /ORGANISM="Euplotes crassus, Strain CT5" /LENGTH=147 /DNA_ID=CAMNT_0042432353 /DNA_START=15 /DNA_END=458 /DNA_ORIENTATION=+
MMPQTPTIKDFAVKTSINPACAGSVFLETSECKIVCEIEGPSISGAKNVQSIQVRIEDTTVDKIIEQTLGDDDFEKDKELKVKRVELEQVLTSITENLVRMEEYPNMELAITFKIFENRMNIKQYLALALSMALVHSGIQTNTIMVP